MGRSLPVEVWVLIARETEVNPLIYTKGAHICRDARTAYFRDAVWRKFAVDGVRTDIALHYHKLLWELDPDTLRDYMQMWAYFNQSWAKHPLEEDPDWMYTNFQIGELRRQLSTAINPNIRMFGHVYMAWAHFNGVAWWDASVRWHPDHAKFVRKAWLDSPVDLKAAIELYGPLLKYGDEAMLDDEDLVLAAVAYDLGPTVPLDLNHEWTYWRTVVPYKLISTRLKMKKNVTLAFLQRWPSLIQYVPEELLEDPQIKVFT